MKESRVHWSENTVGYNRLVHSVRSYSLYAFWVDCRQLGNNPATDDSKLSVEVHGKRVFGNYG